MDLRVDEEYYTSTCEALESDLQEVCALWDEFEEMCVVCEADLFGDVFEALKEFRHSHLNNVEMNKLNEWMARNLKEETNSFLKDIETDDKLK